jgi:hypothetical protein
MINAPKGHESIAGFTLGFCFLMQRALSGRITTGMRDSQGKTLG